MSVPSLEGAFDDMDEAHPEEGAGQVTPSSIESRGQGAEAESLAAMRGQRIGDGMRACRRDVGHVVWHSILQKQNPRSDGWCVALWQ